MMVWLVYEKVTVKTVSLICGGKRSLRGVTLEGCTPFVAAAAAPSSRCRVDDRIKVHKVGDDQGA